MATLLYVFPHPDDESFGPAPALARQRAQGHDVHVLTLTRGEATQQRHRLGLSKEEMGAVRFGEMQRVAQALDLSSLNVLDLPDGELANLSPLDIEEVVMQHLVRLQPDVVVTYAVHGVSGHPDHLVTHAVVKRVVCSAVSTNEVPVRRLAFFTLRDDDTPRPDHLQPSPDDAIDCVVPMDEKAFSTAQAALQCYETYAPVIEEHRPLETVRTGVCFECFREAPTPRLTDLTAHLPAQLPLGSS
jgi:LmbE family N-acetylglucosaminyl deacetylase